LVAAAVFLMATKKQGEAKASPKSSTERGQTRTAKDNAWAQTISGGKYDTLRKLMTAIHKGEFVVVAKQELKRLNRAGTPPGKV